MRLLLVALGLLTSLAAISPLVSPAGAPPARWTVMVYMAGDNNLESVGIVDFLEMSSVGSTADVEVVVQFDRAVGFDRRYGDWTTTKRFHVTQGMTPDPSYAMADLGELDMTDPAVLEDFVVWAATSYPADRYFLDVWDHGLGWQGVVTDGPSFLTTQDLGRAITNATGRIGRGLDLVGNDACRMTLEIMVELAPYVDYFVGSQKDEPLDGWPYDALLRELVATPGMSAAEVGDRLVRAYVESYVDNSQYSVTLSVVSSAALPALLTALDAYADELNRSLPYAQASVVAARSQTEHYEREGLAGGEEYDLYHFTERIDANLPNRRLTRLGDTLRASIVNAVVSERHWDHPNPINDVHAANAHGLSVWFPDAAADPSYGDLAMSRTSEWDDFLRSYRDGEPPSISLEARAGTFDEDGDGLSDGITLEYWTQVGGTVGVDLYADGAYVLSHTYRAPVAAWESANLTPLPPGDYTAYVYLWNATKLLNITTIPSIVVEGLVRFQGTVRSVAGAMAIGAEVTLRNARTGDVLTAVVSATGYEILAPVPTWFREGDPLELIVSYEGRTSTFSFAGSTRTPTQTLHVIIDTDGGAGGADPWLVLLVVIGIVGTLFLLFIFWRRRVPKA